MRDTAEKKRGSMPKKAIVQRVAEILDSPNVPAEAAVEAVLATFIASSAPARKPVTLWCGGTWEVRAKRVRVHRNPKTGAA